MWNRPFVLLNDSGVRRILDPIIAEFKRSGVVISTDPIEVQNNASRALIVVKNKITAELKGKLVSLQIDLCTRMQRCIFGVNASVYNNGKVTIRTLAMKHLRNSTGGLEIALEIEKVLAEYELQVDDIYAITSDNGTNVLACTKILRMMQERRLEDLVARQTVSMVNVEALIELIDIESNRIAQGQTLSFLHQVRCSAHTENLAIGDAMQIDTPGKLVEKCRKIVKHLRRPNITNLLEDKGLKRPILDSDVRWSSIHGMVSAENT